MSLIMTKQEREAFLADVHVGIISIAEERRGPLTVPIWYAYDSGGDLRIMTGRRWSEAIAVGSLAFTEEQHGTGRGDVSPSRLSPAILLIEMT